MLNTNRSQIPIPEDVVDVDIRLFAKTAQDSGFPVELSSRKGGFRSGQKTLKIPTIELTEAELNPETYGKILGRALFSEAGVGDEFKQALALVSGSDAALRVRLQLDADELQAVKWERIFHPSGTRWNRLASFAKTPFSRYLPAQKWTRPPAVTQRPLKVLVILASPNTLDRYQLDSIDPSEFVALHDVFSSLKDVQATFLESGTRRPPTMNNIRRELANGVHFVHFLCHGAASAGGTVLYLDSDDSTVDPVAADRLIDTFAALGKPPLLCYLSACETALRARSDGFAPLGPELVEGGGVHAVVAMSDRIQVKTARLFTEKFYERLLHHGQIDLAMNQARAIVQDKWDWGVPILFSRLSDNQLVDFPVGEIYNGSLAHIDSAFATIDVALDKARKDAHAETLVRGLEALIEELSKSHKVLVDVASNYRRTGNDAKTFRGAFEQFYLEFKDYYDNNSWMNEDTSCMKVAEMRDKLLPHLQSLLDAATFEELKSELIILGDADRVVLRFFKDYLDQMNAAVEESYRLLQANDVKRALAHKQKFEAHISPSFQKSKQMLAEMNQQVGHVRAA